MFRTNKTADDVMYRLRHLSVIRFLHVLNAVDAYTSPPPPCTATERLRRRRRPSTKTLGPSDAPTLRLTRRVPRRERHRKYRRRAWGSRGRGRPGGSFEGKGYGSGHRVLDG